MHSLRLTVEAPVRTVAPQRLGLRVGHLLSGSPPALDPHAPAAVDPEGSQDTQLIHSVFSITEIHGPHASSLLGPGLKKQSCPVLRH